MKIDLGITVTPEQGEALKLVMQLRYNKPKHMKEPDFIFESEEDRRNWEQLYRGGAV